MSDDLVAFLRARVYEDEATANGLFFACRMPDRLPVFDFAGGPAAETFWRHFSPARALREVEAKWAILREHTPETRGRRTACSSCSYGNSLGANWPCLTVEKTAAIYSDHPGYRPEWAPITQRSPQRSG